MEKKLKLPRKRKKAYIKALGGLTYMSALIVGEMCISGEIDYNPVFNPRKFKKDTINHPNGLVKKVISYW